DRSGSMAGAKIDNAQDAALAFLNKMRDDDQLAIVTYGSDVTVNLRLNHVGNVRGAAQRIIRNIDAGGGTNIGGGLRTAVQQLAATGGPRRVVLISDGRPTEGERRPQMLAAIAAGGREQGISFASIGVGIDYDENVMEGIALRGGGAFYHLRHFNMLAGIVTKEFQSIDTIVASDIRLRIDPGSNVSIEEVYGYDFGREGSSVVVRVGDISRGDQLRVVARSRVNTGGPALARFAGLGLAYRIPESGSGESATASLTYATTPDVAVASNSQKVDVVVTANKVAAAAMMRESMEKMASGQRDEGVASLKRAKVQLDLAAKRAPAAAAPALRREAARYNELEAKARSVSIESEDGQDFVKTNRAAAFSEQQGR
ncbi:MAG: VWA domain-containing protein, partial [Deltaproteobacteria bacterium]|nr:VWA domain-containing protein [Deltaproteobacteria bacterium]